MLDQAHQPAYQCAGAPHREMHAPTSFQRGDQAVDRGRREGVAADQQRLKGEYHAQLRVAHVARRQAMHAAPGLEPQQVQQRARHVGPMVEGLMHQLLEADFEDALAGLQESFVAFDVAGCQAGDLGAHRRRVAADVEMRAVVEADAVERRHRPQHHVVGQSPAGHGPELFEQMRRGDHGRAGVEGIAIDAVNTCLAARLLELFEHGDAPAACAQAHRSRQAAEPAADDHCMRPPRLAGACQRRLQGIATNSQHEWIIGPSI